MKGKLPRGAVRKSQAGKTLQTLLRESGGQPRKSSQNQSAPHLVKGSRAAKEHMAKLRAMRKK